MNQVSTLRAQVEQLKRHCLQKQQLQQRQIKSLEKQQQHEQQIPPLFVQQQQIVPEKTSVQQEIEQLLNKALKKVKQSKI